MAQTARPEPPAFRYTEKMNFRKLRTIRQTASAEKIRRSARRITQPFQTRTQPPRLCSLHDREESGNAGSSGERVFCGIREGFRLIIGNIAHAEELEDLEQELAIVAEGHRAVVRIALLDEDMAVEAAHLRDGEDADAAEAARMHWQNFTLRPHDPKT